MRKWRAMLNPHEWGSLRTLNVRTYQLWAATTLLVGLSFTSAFFYERHHAYAREVARLQQIRRDLELQASKQAVNSSSNTSAFTAQERIELEHRLRSEYEATIATITAKLGDLKDMETQARAMTGIKPRGASRGNLVTAQGGGKGGGRSSLDLTAYEPDETFSSPASVIYGLSQPSADLIIQEIDLRTESLRDLVAGLEAKQEQVLHLPSIWPCKGHDREISSPFGFRKDPYGLHIVHHDGTDISGPFGASVLAAGKGVVIGSEYDGGGLGNLVKIDHGNGIETWYGHLQMRRVQVGDKVNRNEVIGKLGSTGKSTGPHIHYEVHVNGRPVDPAKYLKD